MKLEKLSPELYELFSSKLKQFVTKDAPLPPDLKFNHVCSIFIKDDDDGYNIQFIIYPPPDLYLDYYIPYGEYRAHTRCSYHGRITATGERIHLENYQGEWGYKVYPDDPVRTASERETMIIHNQQVTAILNAKGFLP